MNIVEITLREKEAHLINPPNGNMGLKITNVPSGNINRKDDLIYLCKSVSMTIFNDHSTVAEFKLAFQCDIKLDNDEEFNEKIFLDKVNPYIYSHIASMMGDFDFPQLSYFDFLNRLNDQI